MQEKAQETLKAITWERYYSKKGLTCTRATLRTAITFRNEDILWLKNRIEASQYTNLQVDMIHLLCHLHHLHLHHHGSTNYLQQDLHQDLSAGVLV